MKKTLSYDLKGNMTEREPSGLRGNRSSLGGSRQVQNEQQDLSAVNLGMSRKTSYGTNNLRSSVLPAERNQQVRQLMQMLKLRSQ